MISRKIRPDMDDSTLFCKCTKNHSKRQGRGTDPCPWILARTGDGPLSLDFYGDVGPFHVLFMQLRDKGPSPVLRLRLLIRFQGHGVLRPFGSRG